MNKTKTLFWVWLDELNDLEKKASRRPWGNKASLLFGSEKLKGDPEGKVADCVLAEMNTNMSNQSENTEYIAYSRNLVPEMIETLYRYKRAIGKIQEMVDLNAAVSLPHIGKIIYDFNSEEEHHSHELAEMKHLSDDYYNQKPTNM